MSDFTGVDLCSMISFLEECINVTKDSICNLEVYSTETKNHEEQIDELPDILDFIDYYKCLFQRILNDFELVYDEMQLEITEIQIELLNRIYVLSHNEYKKIALFKVFKRDHINKTLREESVRPLLDNIYEVVVFSLILFQRIEPYTYRLSLFIGKSISEYDGTNQTIQYSEDFRSVFFDQEQLFLTSRQAEVVQYFFENQGPGSLQLDRVLEAVNSNATRLNDVFKNKNELRNKLFERTGSKMYRLRT